MKKLLIIFLSTIILVYCQNSDNKKLKTTAELVNILSSDSLEGRYIGDSGFERAAKFVENYLKLIEVKPFFNGSYRDTLTIFRYHSFNVVGIIENRHSINDYILIGAHLDHLGKMDSQTDSIFNGANDNASGVTAVLQIARELKKYKFNKKVIIALFTGEEVGLKGSKHLAQKLKKANINLSYVINFEMIGTPLSSFPENVYITGFNTSNFGEVANKVSGEEFIVSNGAEFSDGLFGASDNYPFYKEFNIPSHTISTFDFKNYKYYHSVSDEYSQLNIQHMDYIIQKTSKLLIKLLQENSEIKLKY
jgi:Zn-dependent M28 family amino/carboxypeptidase